MATQTGLACPKCGGRMRPYERSQILVEQCEECRGIFLDHGELERLIEAEGGGWSGVVEPPAQAPEPQRRAGRKPRRQTVESLRDLFGNED